MTIILICGTVTSAMQFFHGAGLGVSGVNSETPCPHPGGVVEPSSASVRALSWKTFTKETDRTVIKEHKRMSNKFDHLATSCGTFQDLTESEIAMVCGAAGKGPMEVMGPEFRGPVTSVPDFPRPPANGPMPASGAGAVGAWGGYIYNNSHPIGSTIQNIRGGAGGKH
ncbi:hypothetical protein [Burkholderia sp. IMCC1007]|uniref:hypothetical protein n=1 Tax=Burkholderia sp. IMCC1007 TaxID=3004104 RepID=UPI0022B4180F|nr:hypothetical protein [Burkholderia sp. IMCC1007]